ncbi:MAG: helix-turn-helix transcriptional regulator [Xanthobacteraceae bacterium]|jgi:transcriptional regulator with XRE-family HTH domain
MLVISSNLTDSTDRFGTLLADARKRKRLTLRAVQDAIGISNAYLSQLETGKVQSPSPIVLHKLSELYGIPYATVMQEAGYPLPETVKETDSGTRLAARVGETTQEEEDALVDYIRFLRSRNQRRDR